MEKLDGVIARSKAGRDKGELFIILRTENGYAFIANGDRRKVDRPKKKKLKHLQLTGYMCEFVSGKLAASGKVTNQELRKALAEYTDK